MEQNQQASPSKNYYKKLYCPLHSNKFMYRCEFQNCVHPLICSAASCLQEHFHIQNDGRLVIVKINSTQSFKKFGEIERIFTKEDFASEAKQLKSFIDDLKLSMVTIYKDYKQLSLKKEYFLSENNKPYEQGFQQKIDQTIMLGNNLRKNIDSMKKKLNFSNSNIQDHAEENTSRSFDSSQSQINSKNYNPRPIESQKVGPNKNISQQQQGQMGFQSSPRNLNTEIPIVLQNSAEPVINNFNFMQKPISLNGVSGNSTNPKSPLRTVEKDKFDQLFQTGTTTPMKNDHEQKINNLETSASNASKLIIGKNGNLSTQKIINGQHQKSKNLNNSVNQIVIDSGQDNIAISNNLKTINSQTLKIFERKFFMKQQLTLFLEKTIKNFSWGLFDEIYNSYMPLKPIDKFHEMLQGRRNLLFLFIGQGRILGSYYPSRYPRLTQKLRTDPNSFLFISNNENNKILEFKAVPSEFHLSVNDKLYICQGNTPSYADGIRTFQKNFQAVNYCLPSFSYKYHSGDSIQSKPVEGEQNIPNFNGILSVKEFFVLQFLENSS